MTADDDEQREAGGRRDHARIAGDQPLHLRGQRDPVADRVAGGDQRGVAQQQRQAELAVDAVPPHQPVEPDEAVQHRQPREQQQLDEHEVGAEQPGDPPEAREQARGVVDVAQPARRHPQCDDRRRVGQREERQPPAGEPSAPRGHARSVAPPHDNQPPAITPA